MIKLPQHIQKLIEELRSGEHTQTVGTLKRNLGGGEIGYCCLGVYLEKVKDKSVRAVARSNSENEGAIKWYELCSEDLGAGLKDKLACMNDDGKTFEEIADYIEEVYYNKKLEENSSETQKKGY